MNHKKRELESLKKLLEHLNDREDNIRYEIIAIEKRIEALEWDIENEDNV